MAHSYVRGHQVHSEDGKSWYYSDTGEPMDDSRPCARCGEHPTEEGHDPCIGHLNDSNVVSACCGHGNWGGVVLVRNDEIAPASYRRKDGSPLPVEGITRGDIEGPLGELDIRRKSVEWRMQEWMKRLFLAIGKGLSFIEYIEVEINKGPLRWSPEAIALVEVLDKAHEAGLLKGEDE